MQNVILTKQTTNVTVGRATDNNVVVNNEFISRYHGEIKRTSSGWVYIDHSTNGSVIHYESGSVRVHRNAAAIYPGCLLEIGKEMLEVCDVVSF